MRVGRWGIEERVGQALRRPPPTEESPAGQEAALRVRKYRFVMFTQRHCLRSTSPQVTLTTRGIAYLNYAAALALGEPEAVVLFFETATQMVGMKPAARGSSHAYVLRKQKNARTYVLSMTAFVHYYGLPLTKRSFAASMEDGFLVFGWQQGTEMPKRQRAKNSPLEQHV